MVRKASLLIDVKIGWNRLLQKKVKKLLSSYSRNLSLNQKILIWLYMIAAPLRGESATAFFLRQIFDDANEDVSTSVLRWQLRLVYNL